MELSDGWRAAIADEELRRTWLDDESTDGEGPWEPIAVPGHWRSNPAFADTDGPLLYRNRFTHARPEHGRRAWVTFDGMFYEGDVWLDNTYVGDTEGYFFPHTFEVTDALADRTGHTLGVDLACSRPSDLRAKRNITGVFQHSDCLDPDWNPGGIWRPVRIEQTGPIRIAHLRVVCREANVEQAVLRVRAVLDAAGPGAATVRTTVGGAEHIQELTVAGGENQLEWNVTVPEPRLWWPRVLGDQPMESVVVSVIDGDDEKPSHIREIRTGLRQIAMHDWVMSVNGERLFLKGANVGPTRMALADASPAELAADVEMAVDLGLDLLRVHGHISRPELYAAADEAGMLIWQDFPLQWGYARGIRKQAVRQAREAVDLLGHHPSVAIWCGHNEPFALDIDRSEQSDMGSSPTRFFAAQELPTWNKTVLDRSVRRALDKADGTRPVIAHSGVLPHPPLLDGTDSHLYYGWYYGEERGLGRLARRLPRLVRFVSEFGTQAVPETDEFMDADAWPDLDWERLAHTHGLQKSQFDRYVPPADHLTYDGWKAATQRHQAEVIKHHIETLRRLKYRPTGGFAQYCLADSHPAVSWSVLDHTRQPKGAYATLAAACRPVIVVAERLPVTVAPGDSFGIDVHVVSDLRTELSDARVDVTLSWNGGGHEWHWGGIIEADTCQRVGTMQFVVPEDPGELVIELTLTAAGHDATNRYASTVIAPGI